MSKPLPVLKFTKYYQKLDYPLFNTIRLATPLTPGEYVQIHHPFGNFRAIVKFTHPTRVRDIATSILMWDTGTHTREEALEHLREYYPGLGELTDVVLIGLEKERPCPFF